MYIKQNMIFIFNEILQNLNGSIYSKFISDTVDFMTTTNIIGQSIPTACLITGLILKGHVV